ncbi:MAG: 30S ribosomal protein S6--L-glutamate ligase, partial [Thiohalorhabdaceae bacterium]
IENATNKDVGAQLMQFIEKNAKPYKTKTRGKG